MGLLDNFGSIQNRPVNLISRSGVGAGPFAGQKITAGNNAILPATGRSQSVGRPSGMPDYDWLAGGDSSAKATMVAFAAIAGTPPSYTTTTNGFIMDRGRGRPYLRTGCFTSLTRPNGAQLVGSQSFAADPAGHIPGFVTNPLDSLLYANGGMPVAFQEGETILQYADTNALTEQCQSGMLFCYGSVGHKYPETVEDLIRISGLGNKVKEIWYPRVGLTASLTVMTPTVTLNAAATTDDRWIDSDSEYYILGAVTQSVAAASGLLNFSQGLPDFLKVRNNCIPYGNSFYAASGASKGIMVCPYWPIGPFSAANPVQVGATGTAAAAQIVKLAIAKC